MRRFHSAAFRTPLYIPVVVALSAVAVACGGDGDGAAAVEVLDEDGASLGSVAFPVSCNAAAGTEMRRGLALLHNMTYTEAEKAFETAAERDPTCALAYWGMAMTYLHPLWPDVPSDEQLDEGWALLQEARGHALATDREEAYVAALEAYYRDAPTRSEPARLTSYASAWQEVAAAHPDDSEAALFKALSLIATAPPSDKSFASRIAAGEIAEGVLSRIPDHPGAQHYVIHAFDVPPLAERALPVARTYGEVAPENSHALHMTSHIFTRVGLWEESIHYNERAAAAALLHPIDGATSHHHLHAVDYLAYAHLQRSDDDAAREVLGHLSTLDGPVVNHAASAYAFAAVPARLALERQRWADAAELPTRQPETIPWDRYPHLEAIPVFARALGAAHTDDLASARRSSARLSELQVQAAAMPSAYDWGIQVEIQAMGASAWIAYAEGRADEAVAMMAEAARLESTTEKNPVTPGEVLPAGELLGDMLLDLGRHEQARVAYDAVLERSPNRLNSLFGAGRASELAEDAEAALTYFARLVDMASPSAQGEHLEHARRLVGEG